MFDDLFEVSGVQSLRILSFNVRGLNVKAREKLAFLRRLVDTTRVDIILLQETNLVKGKEGILPLHFSDFLWVFSERVANGSGLAIGLPILWKKLKIGLFESVRHRVRICCCNVYNNPP